MLQGAALLSYAFIAKNDPCLSNVCVLGFVSRSFSPGGSHCLPSALFLRKAVFAIVIQTTPWPLSGTRETRCEPSLLARLALSI